MLLAFSHAARPEDVLGAEAAAAPSIGGHLKRENALPSGLTFPNTHQFFPGTTKGKRLVGLGKKCVFSSRVNVDRCGQ